MNSSKLCKLSVHRNQMFENSDLLLNPKDFPHLKIGDIVEIYHAEEEFSRLLLQVTTFNKDAQGKIDVVSVEQSVAQTFQLRTYHEVIVNKVEFSSVVLDSVEVTFKDQYLGRSEMWRLKMNVVNTCVYLNKKIEFCGSTARVQVYEMWSQGEKVACGVIGANTKLIFRSSTCMVYLFLQMSSEMWEFDVHGDLYFEKAVNGFLSDLFQKWKTHGSNHEVTIVLFSRVFYKANYVDEFPDYMREFLQQDYKGHFYEDFYRVAVQNEKYEDWSNTLVLLQNLFSIYKKTVLECHKKPGYKVPCPSLSTAVHGNFLEVLNIALNVFDKHYLERNLDRTGQLAVVISPGVGVFEVDRELTNVTKQRIIDNGVGCDLVCLGEQPLHAVPLLKFYNKDITIKRDDYSMPHWINLSFYSSEKMVAYSKFVPRIKIPPRRTRISSSHHLNSSIQKTKLPTDIAYESLLPGSNDNAVDVDYDSYDNDVFTLPSSHIVNVQKLLTRTKKLSLNQDPKFTKWKLSDPDIYRSYLSSSYGATSVPRSTSIDVAEPAGGTLPRAKAGHRDADRLQHFEFAMDEEIISPQTTNSSVGSSACSVPPLSQGNSLQNTFIPGDNATELRLGRALVNPFDPSRITVKMTSNRRRWTHVFPKGPRGAVIQHHHHHPCNYLMEDIDRSRKSSRVLDTDLGFCFEDDPMFVQFPNLDEFRTKPKGSSFVGSPGSQTLQMGKKSQTLLWGVTGEQPWTPALTTSVDWKSLIIPACLPITTDYFPDEVCLKLDYVFSDYNLLPDDVNADFARKRAIYREPLTTMEVFRELISQRLAQGFQLIEDGESGSNQSQYMCMVGSRGTSDDSVAKECKLSIGRIFHKLSLCKSEIRITRYRPNEEEEGDAELRHLQQSNRQLSCEICALLKLLWEQYKVHGDVLSVDAATSGAAATPIENAALNQHSTSGRTARRRIDPNANASSNNERIQNIDSSEPTTTSPITASTSSFSTVASSASFHPQTFDAFLGVLVNLERVAVDDFFDEDFFFGFIQRFVSNYAHVFMVEPERDAEWRARLTDDVADFVQHARSDRKLKHLFFLLRANGLCDLLVFNVTDASFYFYEGGRRPQQPTIGSHNLAALAAELVFFLRRLLRADQLVHARCSMDDASSSSVFAVEMLLRILFNAVDFRLEAPSLSMTQLAQLPSNSDAVAAAIVSQFVAAEIGRVQHVLANSPFTSANFSGNSVGES